MSPPKLEVGGLYIALFLLNNPPDQPPAENTFHWGLYFHHGRLTGGTRYHVKEIVPGWIADHGPISFILGSLVLVGLLQIASVPEDLNDYLDKTVRTYDNELNDRENITSRSWVFDVLKLLQDPVNGVTILQCQQLGELEEEAMELGKEHAQAAAFNVQPRPITISRFFVTN